MYSSVLLFNTAMPQHPDLVFGEFIVITIAVLNRSRTDVDKQEEPEVTITEYDALTAKPMEKANMEVGDDNEEVVKKHALMTKIKMSKGCENCCCFPHCILNEHRKTVGKLDVYEELSKESLFPGIKF